MLIDNVIKILVANFLFAIGYVKKMGIVNYKFKIYFRDNSVLLMKGDVTNEANEIIQKTE